METLNSSQYSRKDLTEVLNILYKTQYDILPFDGFEGFNAEFIIKDFFDNIDEDKREEAAEHIITHCTYLQTSLHHYLFKHLDNSKQAWERQRTQQELNTPKQKQMTFTPAEVVTISKKVRTTIYNHLKNGKLKGIQDIDGNWTIKREDLIEYLHRDDF